VFNKTQNSKSTCQILFRQINIENLNNIDQRFSTFLYPILFEHFHVPPLDLLGHNNLFFSFYAYQTRSRYTLFYIIIATITNDLRFVDIYRTS